MASRCLLCNSFIDSPCFLLSRSKLCFSSTIVNSKSWTMSCTCLSFRWFSACMLLHLVWCARSSSCITRFFWSRSSLPCLFNDWHWSAWACLTLSNCSWSNFFVSSTSFVLVSTSATSCCFAMAMFFSCLSLRASSSLLNSRRPAASSSSFCFNKSFKCWDAISIRSLCVCDNELICSL